MRFEVLLHPPGRASNPPFPFPAARPSPSLQLMRQAPADVAAGLSAASEALAAASVKDAEGLLDRAGAELGVRPARRGLDKKGGFFWGGGAGLGRALGRGGGMGLAG